MVSDYIDNSKETMKGHLRIVSDYAHIRTKPQDSFRLWRVLYIITNRYWKNFYEKIIH